MNKKLNLEERALLSDRERRRSTFASLTGILGVEKANTVLDVLKQGGYQVPSNIEEYLQQFKGRRFDFIGAGISGVTSAYFTGELSRLFGLDWEIHLWDRLEGAGLKSTKDSAARIRTSMFGTPEEISGNLATSLFFENLSHLLVNGAADHGGDFSADDVHSGLSRCGYLWLFEGNHGNYERVETSRRLLAEFGVPTFILQPEEVSDLLMPGVNRERFQFAYFCPTDAHVEPTSIVSSLYTYSRRILGLQAHFREEIVEVEVREGERVNFKTRNLGSGLESVHGTDYLGLTTGACSKEMGRRFVLDSVRMDLTIPVIPKPRQLTYALLSDEADLEEHELFTIFMGDGAYWSRETSGSRRILFGFAWEGDKEVAANHIFVDPAVSDQYFVENMLLGDGRLDGIHKDIGVDNHGFRIVQSRGNYYGETVDGKYLVGLIQAANTMGAKGVVGIDAAHNGHGIMSSLGTAAQLVYRLTGILSQEHSLYDPNREMRQNKSVTKRL